ncbi:alpha/beta hydrolase [Kribbella sp. GL6]|uniref:alpha/beta hydrolase n=1 Tax=Kribbella sp. GL6 TaxID=3419765 RepID=UPI003CFC5366
MSDTFSTTTTAGKLSGRIAGPRSQPRGLVIALHGGTYDSAYYETGAGSLLELAEPLGLCVVALDRPGYGATADLDPLHLSFTGQTDVLLEAVQDSIEQIEPQSGVVLVGHSIGGMIALHVAARKPAGLKGVEVSGLGAVWRPGMLEMWSSFVSDAANLVVPAEPHAQVMFGPEGTYAEAQRAADAGLIRPMPMPELVDVVRWADDFPTVAAGIEVPVSLTFAEHDNIWMTDEAARTAAAALFTNAPQVDINLLRTAGHCAEWHNAGRAYNLRQLAFVEERMAG